MLIHAVTIELISSRQQTSLQIVIFLSIIGSCSVFVTLWFIFSIPWWCQHRLHSAFRLLKSINKSHRHSYTSTSINANNTIEIVCHINANTMIADIRLNMKRKWNNAHIVERKRLKQRVDVQSNQITKKRRHISLKHTGMVPSPTCIITITRLIRIYLRHTWIPVWMS